MAVGGEQVEIEQTVRGVQVNAPAAVCHGVVKYAVIEDVALRQYIVTHESAALTHSGQRADPLERIVFGSVIAAVVLTVLPEALRGLEDYRMLIYAIVLIAVMVLNNNLRFQQLKQSMKDRLSRVLRRIFRRKEAKA